MTGFEIKRFDFNAHEVLDETEQDERLSDWPVVYTIDNERFIYVGESQHVDKRMAQHLKDPKKSKLRRIRVVVDERFNRSVCHDLESTLIRWLSGDEKKKYKLLNGNVGITNANYYRRDEYRSTFRDIFDQLQAEGMFKSSIAEIENSDLFKLSPYKALNPEQEAVVEAVMEGLATDLETGASSFSVIQGDPGTGKTIVAIYILKLIQDLAEFTRDDEEPESRLGELFADGTHQLFRDLRIGLVIPQGSLRSSIEKVFKKVPALAGVRVLNAFAVGDSDQVWDILLVDEAHRLTQYAAQSAGPLNGRYKKISTKLFGEPLDPSKNQLDWIRAKAKHTILLLDTEQAVRPSDIEPEVFERATAEASRSGRRYHLMSQMRVAGGNDYIEFVRKLFSDLPPSSVPDFGNYDFRIYTDFAKMRADLRAREEESGLARLVAGYAWEWESRNDWEVYDITIGGESMRWNGTNKDWINSPDAAEEVGSIHTVQGYDLNYAGVIIGGDLRRDPATGALHADRQAYRDSAGKVNNDLRQRKTTDDDLLRYIRNIYRVLMTRGMRGTYVYATDPHVLAGLEQFTTGSE